jgi:glycosyltransferase involved in cell wall biosynthesis
LIPEYKLKSVVVNNIIDEKKLLYLSKEFNPFSEDNMVKIVTVARIDNNQKRIDRIIECCSRLKSEKIVNFSWTIIGDGPDLNNLKKEAESKKVDLLITFLGRKSNPYPYIKNADLLVMSSSYEAYSMVLLESVSLETPILCTNYASAHEIVNDGVNGILVENSTNGLYEGLRNILLDTSIIERLNMNIRNSRSTNELAIEQFYSTIK